MCSTTTEWFLNEGPVVILTIGREHLTPSRVFFNISHPVNDVNKETFDEGGKNSN